MPRIIPRLIPIAALIFGVACTADTEPTNTASETATTEAASAETPGTTEAPTTTTAQQDPEVAAARDSAESYLETVGGFSRDGLIDQLAYEGFTSEAAAQAVDSLNIDWMAQAVESAQSYMDSIGGFSHSGLVDQLVYEGFTPEQAEHGAITVLGF